jgi:hypothetical protein
MKYYIHKDGQQQGPYSINELKSIPIAPYTMVWHEGMDEWTKAKNVSDLKSILKVTPPPLKEVQPPPIDSKNKVSDNSKKKSSAGKTLLKIVIVLLLIVAGFVITTEVLRSNAHQERIRIESTVNNVIENKKEQKRRDKYRNNLGRYLIPTTNNYKKDLVFGGIWDLEIKLKNNTPYMMNKVAVKLFYIKADGGTYQTRRLFFNNVKPNQQIVLDAPNSEKGVEVRCQIDGLNSFTLGINGLSM